MKAMIEAGAAGVHFEDQLSSEKKCGHMGGKVLIPTQSAIKHLVSARLAADVMGVPTLIVARTDAKSASLITSDIDPADQRFITGERTPEGFYQVRDGLDAAIARGLSYAPYSDLLWFETAEPDLDEARPFRRCNSRAISRQAAGLQLLALLQLAQEARSRNDCQFPASSLAGWATNSSSSRWPASTPSTTACSSWRWATANTAWRPIPSCKQAEFALEQYGYTATKHQREVGTGYFDEVAQVIAGGTSSTTALAGSTETRAVPLRVKRNLKGSAHDIHQTFPAQT